MPGGSDIRAGSAYVLLLLKGMPAFRKSLKEASQHLKDFGGGVAAIGASMTALGTAITAPLALAVKQFADVGSALKDMSDRTGASAAALAELGYAAEQTGASAEDVEIGFKKMQKQIGAAAGGSKSATKTFTDLGLSLGDLQKMSPEQQFEAVGKAIAAIPDPTMRAAKALEVFGKSGTKLTPLLADMDALRQKARDLGIVPDDAQIKLADELGDALDDVKKAAGGVVFQIGSALAGAVLRGAKAVTTIVVGIGKWVKENKGVVLTVAAVGAGIVAAGAAITALGVMIVGAGAVLGGLASVLGAVSAALTFLISPLGLVAAALAAVAWAKWGADAKAAFSTVATVLAPIADTIKQTIGGIGDALAAGNLALAGKIAITGLKAALLQGVAGIATAVGGALGDFVGKIGQQLISGDFAGAWTTALSGIAAAWDALMAGLARAFSSTVGFITDLWFKATTMISDQLLELARNNPALGRELGVDVNLADEQKRSDKERLKQAEKLKQINQAIGNAEKSGTGKAAIVSGGPEIDLDTLRERKRQVEKSLAGGPRNVLADSQKLARDDLAGTKASIDKAADAFASRAESNAEASKSLFKGGAGVAVGAAADAMAELDKLTIEAAKAAADAKDKKKPPPGADDESTAPEAGKGSAAGTFSAAAAGLLGGGGPMQETAKNTAKTAQLLEDMKKNGIDFSKPRQQTGGVLPPGTKPEAPKANVGSLKDLVNKGANFDPMNPQGLVEFPTPASAAASDQVDYGPLDAINKKAFGGGDKVDYGPLEAARKRAEASRAAGAQPIIEAGRAFEMGGSPVKRAQDMATKARETEAKSAAKDAPVFKEIVDKLDDLIEEQKVNTRAVRDNAERYDA